MWSLPLSLLTLQRAPFSALKKVSNFARKSDTKTRFFGVAKTFFGDFVRFFTGSLRCLFFLPSSKCLQSGSTSSKWLCTVHLGPKRSHHRVQHRTVPRTTGGGWSRWTSNNEKNHSKMLPSMGLITSSRRGWLQTKKMETFTNQAENFEKPCFCDHFQSEFFLTPWPRSNFFFIRLIEHPLGNTMAPKSLVHSLRIAAEKCLATPKNRVFVSDFRAKFLTLFQST